MPKNPIIVTGKHKIRLADYDPSSTGPFKDKAGAKKKRKRWAKEIAEHQNALFAQRSYAVLVILHGTDTSGKSSTVGYVFRDVHPAGFSVESFKSPSSEELEHDYLWRCMKRLPRRGHIMAFDRSYYEELSVVRVHPEFLEKQRIPRAVRPKDIWKARAKEIRHFERYLTQNGIVVIKIYLNLSKKAQAERLFERLSEKKKHCKFSAGDIAERKHRDLYRRADEDLINRTATPYAPWNILPADNQWVTRALAAKLVAERLCALKPRYPEMSKEEHAENLALYRKMLREETKK